LTDSARIYKCNMTFMGLSPSEV